MFANEDAGGAAPEPVGPESALPAPHLDLDGPLYAEMRRLAAWWLRGRAQSHTQGPTAFVHEVWLRMQTQSEEVRRDPARFKHTAALLLWRALKDYDRAKFARLPPGSGVRVELDESMEPAEEVSETVLAVRDAIAKLFIEHKRVADVVVAMYFGGLTITETAHELGLDERVVRADWKYAKAWLANELADSAPTP